MKTMTLKKDNSFSETENFINRAELMSIILKKNIDVSMKRELSFFYDKILEQETKDKRYLKKIKINGEDERKLFEFIKREL